MTFLIVFDKKNIYRVVNCHFLEYNIVRLQKEGTNFGKSELCTQLH